jgi:Nickel responsive protein SCO4226-like
MPRYLIERVVGTLTKEQIDAGSRRAMEVMAEMPGLVWIRSYVSDVDGKIYCEYEAPNPEAIREHARRAGLRVDRIIEVALEISPAMFR